MKKTNNLNQAKGATEMIKPMIQHANEIFDDLAYRSYAYNRQRSPEVAPWRWIKIFGEDATKMEKRFAKEDRLFFLPREDAEDSHG